MRIPIILNLLLLIAFPISWFVPLAHTGLLSWFNDDVLTVLTTIETLWESDVFLAIVVVFFALLAPMAKTLLLLMIQLEWLGANMLGALAILGKLAMADIFLIALLIVAAKGVGVGYIETGWGLYLFSACVLVSLLVTELTKRKTYGQ
ncbi:paraquat-inducible protein A [Abyssibius alkaniclasticus]|uniref:paraquat-inducible protein A n=1 Tax=Abyssibius alkaniclasticus TaxID=2881234 RepID=UPI002363B74A|nr:paraquat-inducible protein A [Abyssibius alkaniclasticus]UPH70931.1 paraquat-inducible protein A [Abyssibius alkaniclasticus]|tara:strand:+ start:219 stop:662 length:444 start_codon:yes stop_codon:yes gene_type:complete